MAGKKRKGSKKKTHKTLRQVLILSAAIVLAFAGISGYTISSYVKDYKAAKEKEAKENAVETAKERLARVKKEAQEAEYPEKVIELLSKNPETVEYVENYEKLKDSEPAETIGELTEGEIPQLIQWDKRWGYYQFGTSNIAASGCGPTCMSMVVAGLTGDNTITPAKMSDIAMEKGAPYITEDNSTTWAFITEVCQEWGISCSAVMVTDEQLEESLNAGNVFVCNVGPGTFTEIGHYIVLAGYEDGKVIVHDPFNQKNSDSRWLYEDFQDEIKGMWVYKKL